MTAVPSAGPVRYPVGLVVSRLPEKVPLAELTAGSVAVQVKLKPAVSAVTLCGPQLVRAIGAKASVTVQVSATSVVYQPLSPTSPVAVATMLGALLSTFTVRTGEVKVLPALSVVTTRRS